MRHSIDLCMIVKEEQVARVKGTRQHAFYFLPKAIGNKIVLAGEITSDGIWKPK